MNESLHRKIRPWLCAGLLALPLGCSSDDAANGSQRPAENAVATIAQGQSPDDATQEKMLAAKDALFTKLSGRLMEAMSTQGPAAAIAVCKQEAPEIAKAIGEQHGLQIGRVGVRLRNPANVAPSWATEMVNAKTGTPTFVMLDNGHAAALLPIRLQAQCVMCHGPSDAIAPMIQEQLTRLYPDDRATGFQEGDLRGWFWIDSPTTNNSSS